MKKIFYIFFLIAGISVQVNGQWTRTSAGLPLTNNTSVSDITLTNDNLVVGLFGNSKGIYYSDDSGVTWKQASASLFIFLTSKQVFRFTYGNATLYAGTDDGIFKSTDDGKTWTDADPNTDLPNNSVIRGLSAEGSILYAATYGSEVNLTTDNGNNWSKIKDPSNKNVRSLLVSNNRLFAGTESGLYYFEGTDNWFSPTFVPGSTNNKSFYSLAKIGSILFAGTATGTSYRSTNNGLTWTEITTLTNATSFVAKDNIIFASTDGGGVYSSADNGVTWRAINTNLTSLSVNGLAIKGNTLFAGTTLGGIWSRPLPQLTSPSSGLSYSFNTAVGTPSVSQSMRVTGVGLAGNITVSVPAPFEVSLSSNSGFSQSLTLTLSNDAVDANVYIRLNPVSSGNTNANITLSSSGVADRTVAVSGSTCPTLTFQSAILPLASYNTPYNQSLITASGTSPYTYTLFSGSLPSGITMTPAGVLSGTTTQLGTFNFGVSIIDGNGCTGSGTASLTVGKGNQSISFGSLAGRNCGETFTLSASSSSGLTVSYSSSNTSVATVSGNVVTCLGVGTTTITTSQAGNSNYNPATDVSQTLTVSKIGQTITFTSLPTKTYGDIPFSLSASSSSSLPVSYSSSNTSIATVSGNTVTITGAGSVNITASQSGNSCYNAATDAVQTLTINKSSQSITFASLPNRSCGETFTLNASSSSGLGITYSSSNPSVATVSGNVVTLVGVGTTTITASQAGNGNYNAATDANQSLTVSKIGQTITFGSLINRQYNDTPFSLSATSTSLLPVTYSSSNTTVATVSGNIVTIVGVGSAGITASQSGNGCYNAATDVVQTLTVNKANQSISFGSLAGRSCGETFTLNATSSSGLAITYLSSDISVATVSGNVVTPIGAGTTTITASQAGNSNFNPALDISQILTVSKVGQTISFNTLPGKTFGDTPFSLSATSSSSLPVAYTSSNTSVATVTGNLVIIMGVGSTIITASQAGNTCYNPATSVVQTLTVGKGNQVITFGSLAGRSCGETFTLSASSSSGLTVSYSSSNTSVATVSGNVVTCLGVGTTTITASQSGNSNYNPATDVSQTLTVSKIGQAITFGSLTNRQVSDLPFSLSATSTSGLPVNYSSSNTSIATVSGNTVTITGAGSVNITASQSGNSCYNAATDAVQTLTINKSSQSITFASLPNRSCGETFTLNALSSSGLSVTYSSSNPSVATISGNVVTPVGAGTTTITASQTGNGNYNSALDVSQTLTVSKVGQTITFNPLTAKTYGDTPFSLSATSTSLLPVTYSSSNTTVATVSGNIVTIVGVGSAGITASQSGNGCYNAATDVVQTLTVNKANQSISFGSLAGRSCGETFTLNATSSSGLAITYLSSDISVATVSGNVVTPIGAGTTTITASQAGNINFNSATDATQSLTVSKGNQTIAFNALPTKTYGDTPFSLSATSGSALPVTYSSSNPAIATISGNTVTITGAGSVNITASQTGNSCYNAATEVVQTLTVNKANQIITFGNLANRNCGEIFTLNATSSSGLPVSYSSSNPLVATVSGRKVTLSSTGNAFITASQLGDGNYNEAVSVEQFLVVGKASQGITFESLPDKIFGQASFTLNATASSGLSVSYSSSNTNVATVSGNTVTILKEGTTIITASQSGNNCFGEATEIQQILTIKADKTLPVISDISAPPVETNNPIPVSAKISDDIGVSSVILKYNGIARPAFINGIITLNKANNDTYIGTIPGNADETGISFVIEAKDLSNNLKTATGQVGVIYPSGLKIAYTRPGGGVSNYRLISIPLELDNKEVTTVFDELNGYDPKRWRVYTYANGNLIEYGKGFNNFIQGRGYWFVSKNSINRPTGKGNSFANTVQTPLYTIISQGFTLIGNPYNYNISWDDVLNYPKNKKWKDAGLKLTTWTADPTNDKIPRWSKIDSVSSPGNRRLLRYEGGYVGLTLPVTDTLFFPPVINPAVQKTASPFITKRVMSEKDWQINFSLRNVNQEYNLSALGMKPDALITGDKYDALTVPRFLDYLEFNAYHKDFFYLPFSEDIVPVAENYFWEFVAESNAEKQVTELKWKVPDFAEKEFVLFDMKSQKRINMKKENSYLFQLESTNAFRIYYGSKEYVEKNLEPVSFELMQNHPNPFNEKTTIEFTLPESSDLYSVEMNIYDELGRELGTLLKGEYKGGFYEHEWEGKDGKGIKLHSGIYFCKLKIKNENGSEQKIIRILIQ